ncbi:MAG: dihydropteroate synthase-like protein [Candidatus Alkanophagales archaeon]|nr:MAG: dihydropteroate synthase-like protein [Candidatus Alkanophagales archaeon]
MRVLLITGRRAEKLVREAAKAARTEGVECDVAVLDVDVAAFITPEMLREFLKTLDDEYDLVLVSGLCGSDFSILDGVATTRKGTKNAYDIPLLLPLLKEGAPLSGERAADELVASHRLEVALKELEEAERAATASFSIKGLKIGGGRMKICAEVVDATRLEETELRRRIEDYVEKGADIVDLGVPLDAKPADVEKVVRVASDFGVPLSIDTFLPPQIAAALNAGVDMVMSLSGKNLETVSEHVAAHDVAAVLTPDEPDAVSEDKLVSAEDRVRSLLANIKTARKIGVRKIIADPVLSPPLVGRGILGSLLTYYFFRAKDKKTPLLFGVGNVTELLDADSVGVNAVLACVAAELDVDILFTTEHSPKTRGGIKELRQAAEMTLLARRRNMPPKDLGLDLLVVKEKRRRTPPDAELRRLILGDAVNVVNANASETWTPDPKGCFEIATFDDEIYAKHSSKVVIKGKTAKDVLDTILKFGLVSSLEHAAYLGRELLKAELSLRFSRSYVQDETF